MFNVLEAAVAKEIADELSRMDAEVQPNKGRIVVWVEGVPFELAIKQVKD